MFGLKHRAMNPSFTVRIEQDALIVSFPAPARTLSWAVLNGGFCHADHVINHHVSGNDRLFCAQPERWLEAAAARLDLQGHVVAMATAVKMNSCSTSVRSRRQRRGHCFATVGCGNALSVGDPASATTGGSRAVAAPHHQYNTRRAARTHGRSDGGSDPDRHGRPRARSQ